MSISMSILNGFILFYFIKQRGLGNMREIINFVISRAILGKSLNHPAQYNCTVRDTTATPVM